MPGDDSTSLSGRCRQAYAVSCSLCCVIWAKLARPPPPTAPKHSLQKTCKRSPPGGSCFPFSIILCCRCPTVLCFALLCFSVCHARHTPSHYPLALSRKLAAPTLERVCAHSHRDHGKLLSALASSIHPNANTPIAGHDTHHPARAGHGNV